MRVAASAVIAALALAAGGCGEREEVIEPGKPRELSLLLDYFPNADHAPIYAALGGGHFDAVNLDLKIRTPSDPAAPLKQLAAGRTDLAISYEPEVLRARDQGQPVTAVAALVQQPLTSIISLPAAGIDDPTDLAGRTVGTAGIDYQTAFLKAILDEAAVDPAGVTERNLGFNLVPGLLTDKADAVLGAFWNYEGEDLKLQGRVPQIIRVEDAGVPSYDELVVVANDERLRTDPEPIRQFLAALARGNQDLQGDPEAGLDALIDANPDLDPKLQRAVIDVTLPYFEPPRGKPYGWLEPKGWAEFGAFMREAGLLEAEPDGKGYTNGLLPGQPE